MPARVARTDCPWGHPYSGKNVGYSARNGAPFCKHCRRVAQRGQRRGGMSLRECYLIWPEWLEFEEEEDDELG